MLTSMVIKNGYQDRKDEAVKFYWVPIHCGFKQFRHHYKDFLKFKHQSNNINQ